MDRIRRMQMPALRMAITILLAGAVFATPALLGAQEAPPLRRPSGERPEPNASDVQSPDAIIQAVYEVVSGEAGEARNWERFRSLFLPEARLIPASKDSTGERGYWWLTVDEFIKGAKVPIEKKPFYEREVDAVTERYGDLAHVFSTYEALRSPDGEPFERGVNSFQLWYDGDRWWIVNIFWQDERHGGTIPDKYMH